MATKKTTTQPKTVKQYLVIDNDGDLLAYGTMDEIVDTLNEYNDGDDEDDEQHVRQIEHRRDVDVVVWFVVFLAGTCHERLLPVQLIDPREQLVSVDVHVGGKLFHP